MKRHIKLIKTYFKPLKRDQRKNFTQKKLPKFKGDARKTWSVMKEYLDSAPQNSLVAILATKITANKPWRF